MLVSWRISNEFQYYNSKFYDLRCITIILWTFSLDINCQTIVCKPSIISMRLNSVWGKKMKKVLFLICFCNNVLKKLYFEQQSLIIFQRKKHHTFVLYSYRYLPWQFFKNRKSVDILIIILLSRVEKTKKDRSSCDVYAAKILTVMSSHVHVSQPGMVEYCTYCSRITLSLKKIYHVLEYKTGNTRFALGHKHFMHFNGFNRFK